MKKQPITDFMNVISREGCLRYNSAQISLEQERSLGLNAYQNILQKEAEKMSLTLLAQLGETALSTHPTDYDRIAKIRSLLPEALEYYTGTIDY